MREALRALLALLILCVLAIAAHAETTCKASWYEYGTRTANGERFNPNGFTAAHRSYPFGTWLGIRARNGRKITVRVNDRGPYISGRCIDLSRGAAAALGIIGAGTAIVTIESP
jgi:rare lipoprotein A